MDWNGTRVLVTGGSGFIGGHLIQALTARGAKVFITTRGAHSPLLQKNAPEVTEEELTLPDKERIEEIFKKTHPEIVYHLAALVKEDVGLEEFRRVNVRGTKEVYEAALYVGAKKLIVLGSQAEYESLTAPYSEDMIGKPETSYGISKLEATAFLKQESARHSMNVYVARPSNVYGEGQEPVLVIPIWIRELLNARPLRVSADSTDFVYVGDLVEGLLKLGEHTGGFEIVNFGSGMPTKNRTAAELLVRAHGMDPNALISEENNRTPQVRFLSIEKAKQLLNWTPKTTLEEGLKKTLAWYQAQLSAHVL